MSSINVDVSENPKEVKKQSWFKRQKSSFFSSRRKKNVSRSHKLDSSSLSESEVFSTNSLESFKAQKNSGSIKKKSSGDTNPDDDTSLNLINFECPFCFNIQSADQFPILSSCHHKCCISCFQRYLSIEICESRVNLTCPECQEKLTPNDVQAILENESPLLAKWEEFMLRKVLSVDPDCRWCPAPDCGYAVIAYGCASCPRLSCERPGCNTEFCYHCRQVWHHNQTCDSAHLQRTKQLRVRSNSAAFTQAEEIKPCPKCGALIAKVHDGSCNHMTCSVCEAEFCWLCLQEITDLHYLSPSGCTFWGKKPWSRKKKILWQMGLLVGAPLGIGLVAGIALPVITVGLPVWLGRKIRARRDVSNMPRRTRNAVVAGSVLLAIPISPIVAALVVGIGVPSVLLYVYCVVPFSLCRSGGYGLRNQMSAVSGASGITFPSAFRLDMDTPNDQQPSTSQEETFKTVQHSSRLAAANPSIGEASVSGLTVGSWNISHTSNLDKVSRTEQDGASMRALAGTSITGSLSGISTSACITNRTDMQLKEPDQASIKTQLSHSSTAGLTSVQVHASDNISEHSTSSFPIASFGGNPKKSYSSVPPGPRRKILLSKRSSSVKSSVGWSRNELHNDDCERDSIQVAKSEGSSPLTIVDECQIVLDMPLPDAALDQSSSSQLQLTLNQ